MKRLNTQLWGGRKSLLTREKKILNNFIAVLENGVSIEFNSLINFD